MKKLLLSLPLLFATCAPAQTPPAATRASPWGFGSSAEWLMDGHARFLPLMRDAGIHWFRFGPDWSAVQPRHGEFDFNYPDTVIAEANKNNIHVSGVFAYLAPWASSKNTAVDFPIKDIQYWRDFVEAMVRRYPNVTHWEVWNEFNSTAFSRNATPADYAELVREACKVAKKANPNVKIGISCANFAVPWFDAVIKAGCGPFDFIAIHPYENIGEVVHGGEAGYLSMAKTLREMLAANKLNAKMPLWITELGVQAPVQPDAEKDQIQADTIIKAYALSFAQGFERVCWFEARGPNYGHGTDHGIIRQDWTLRPAYTALMTMTKLLGPTPLYQGWLNPAKDGYAFAFRTSGNGSPVIVAWAPPGRVLEAGFPERLHLIRQDGSVETVNANQKIQLTQSPVFLRLPSGSSATASFTAAKGNMDKPFPWGNDYANAREVSCRLGAENIDNGLQLVQSNTRPDQVGVEPCRRPDFASGDHGRYMQFRINPGFCGFNDRAFDITVVARCLPGKPTGFKLSHESTTGYTDSPGGWKNIPDDGRWHELTWSIDNAGFVGAWGWNFRTDAIGAPAECYIREVRVRKK